VTLTLLVYLVFWTTRKASSQTKALVAVTMTALYWIWESRASGNIRVDLGLIYPILFCSYMVTLWSRFGFWSVPIAFSLMVINFVYFVISYSFFDKNPG
jgi:hypothetical protein